MWKEAKKGWYPNVNINEDKYYKLKYSNKSSAIKSFFGHQCSFGGVFFASYRPERCKKQTLENTIHKINDIGEKVKNVSFSSGSYTKYSHLKNFIIYCDPPYSRFNRYYDNDYQKIVFDHEEFFNWCREMSKHNIIFLSEYKAPKDFDIVANIENNVNHNSVNKNNIDRLYTI